MTRSAAVKQAEEENKCAHSSITDRKIMETPKRNMAQITRSAAAKEAEEKKKFFYSSATDKKILETPKRTTAPITRSAAAKLAQQIEEDESTQCRSRADEGKDLETRTIRNTQHRYSSRSRIEKPVAHKTKTKTSIRKKPFHCIFCNKKALIPAEPYPSRSVGYLDCISCGAAFSFRVTAILTCANDVQATLSVGGNIKWLWAMQGTVGRS